MTEKIEIRRRPMRAKRGAVAGRVLTPDGNSHRSHPATSSEVYEVNGEEYIIVWVYTRSGGRACVFNDDGLVGMTRQEPTVSGGEAAIRDVLTFLASKGSE